MTTSIQIHNEAEAKDLRNEAEQYELQQRENEIKPGTKTKIGGSSRIEISDGNTKLRSDRPTSVSVSKEIPDGYVKLTGGQIASFDAVEAADLTDAIIGWGKNTPGWKNSMAGQPSVNNEAVPENNDKAEADKANQLETSEGEAVTINAAADALNHARETIGATAVDAIQREAISTGDLPTADMLPDGISSEMVETALAGYISQANSILRSTGTSVDGLVMMLNESELKAARVATFTDNDSELKRLGSLAVSRFKNLDQDPALFAEMTKDKPSSIKFERRNGRIWIKGATYDWMPWSEAVEQRKIILT